LIFGGDISTCIPTGRQLDALSFADEAVLTTVKREFDFSEGDATAVSTGIKLRTLSTTILDRREHLRTPDKVLRGAGSLFRALFRDTTENPRSELTLPPFLVHPSFHRATTEKVPE
jgi:hypothetical protein